MEILTLIFGTILGWLIADLAFIQGIEPSGKFSKSFRKFLKPKNWTWLMIYLSTSIITGTICFLTFNLIISATSSISVGIIFIQACVGFVLLHAAIVDIACLQIIIKPIQIPLIIIFIANCVLAVTGNVNNIVAGTVAAVFMFVVISLSKKKGMGEGDLLVFILMGLTLGLSKLIVAFYVMILTGSIVGLLISAKHKKIKGIKIPFVPFMMIGYIVALVWGDAIIYAYISAFFLI